MIVERIKDIVESMVSKPSFVYTTSAGFNLEGDNLDFPVICLFQIVNVTSKIVGQGMYSNYELNLVFVDKTEFDDTDIKNDEVIQAMRILFVEFMAGFTSSGYFGKVGEIKSEAFFSKYDVNTCGVVCSFNVDYLEPEILC